VSNKPSRPSGPVGIRIEGGRNITVGNNKAFGVPVLEAIHVDGLNASGNETHMLSIEQVPLPTNESSASAVIAADSWYKKPFGIVGIGVCTSILAALAWFALRHYVPILAH